MFTLDTFVDIGYIREVAEIKENTNEQPHGLQQQARKFPYLAPLHRARRLHHFHLGYRRYRYRKPALPLRRMKMTYTEKTALGFVVITEDQQFSLTNEGRMSSAEAAKARLAAKRDTSHLVAIMDRLSREKVRLSAAINVKDIAFRSVQVSQAEKELEAEYAFLGMTPSSELAEISDDDLLAELS